MQANQALTQVMNYKQLTSQMELRNADSKMELRASSPEQAEVATPVEEPASIRFMKGKLISVDCSQPPQALLTVVAVRNRCGSTCATAITWF